MSHIPPPALPQWTREDPKSVYVDSSWDALAIAIQKASIFRDWKETRFRWLRFSLFHWHCRRPMRIGVVEYKDADVEFGWERAIFKQAACRECGFFKDWL